MNKYSSAEVSHNPKDSAVRKRLLDKEQSKNSMVPRAGYNHINDDVHIPKTKHYHGVKSEDFSPTENELDLGYATSSLMNQGPKGDSTACANSSSLSKTFDSSHSTKGIANVQYYSDSSTDEIGSDTLSSCQGKLKHPQSTNSGSMENLLITEDSFNTAKPETMVSLALQILFPFLIAGCGMVAAGIVLDKVQHWEVFEKVPEIFILVPALLGLKGNLEMTLASRLSTSANRGLLDVPSTRWSIVWGNIVLVEAQALAVAFLTSLVAMVFGWIPDGTWETNHAIILCTGSLLTGTIASFILGIVMIMVIICSRKVGINPDNVATPIAASLGDLITLSILAFIAKGMYSILYNPSTHWVGWALIAFFCLLTPVLLWLAHKNPFTRDVVLNGWEPVIAAMTISSIGGFILDIAISSNPGIAVFSPVVNGVGGNLVAVQASRISTSLHTSGCQMGQVPEYEQAGCVSPANTFCAFLNRHSKSARVMLLMVVPGQLVFLLVIQQLQAGHTTISTQFVVMYLIVSLIQVAILLQVCQWLVVRFWSKEQDPDNYAIPYLTALGDLLGTGLLAAGFYILWLLGDRDADVGD